jgi:hypothetical protein
VPTFRPAKDSGVHVTQFGVKNVTPIIQMIDFTGLLPMMNRASFGKTILMSYNIRWEGMGTSLLPFSVCHLYLPQSTASPPHTTFSYGRASLITQKRENRPAALLYLFTHQFIILSMRHDDIGVTTIKIIIVKLWSY